MSPEFRSNLHETNMLRLGVAFTLLLAAALPVGAQTAPRPASPPLPEKYQVKLRYRIPSARTPHVQAYDRLIADLQKLNFEFQPPLDDTPETDREDPTKNYLKGLLPSKNLMPLLIHPAIANIQIMPADFKLPEQAEVGVRIRLELAGNMETKEQKDLSDQVRAMLELLGFREATAYDHRGLTGRPYTRLVGQIPQGSLDLLLKDLRLQPAGWLESRLVLDKLPAPLRDVNPVHVVEILDDPEAVEPVKDAIPPGALLVRNGDFADVKINPPTSKISPDLWDVMQDAGKKDELVRVQLLFLGEPTLDEVRRDLGDLAPHFQVEGILGATASGLMPAGEIPLLAALPRVAVVRRPHVTLPDVAPGTKTPVDVKASLHQTGLDVLHQSGHRGQGVRIGIIDRDFRGWKKVVASKQLPGNTHLVDLTTERSSQIVPQPELPGDAIGSGTLAAIAAAQGAPGAEIVLIRIEPTDVYQIPEIIGYTKGGRLSDTLIRRYDELQVSRADLVAKRKILADERKLFLQIYPGENKKIQLPGEPEPRNFPDENEVLDAEKYRFLGPAFGWVFSKREWHRQKMARQETLELAHAAREARYQRLLDDVKSLVGIDVLVNPFTWNSGFALGGSSSLTRWFENRDKKNPIVVQSAGNRRGQTWTGLYRDADNNGVMEFAGAETPLPPGRWTRELNFLAWQPFDGARTSDIPEKTKLRVAFQWREPHEPEYFGNGIDDPYRLPLATMRITLLRQRDPSAKSFPADSFEVIARSNPFPQRVQHMPGASVYEHVIDAVLEKKGVYAIRVERQPDHYWQLENIESDVGRPFFIFRTGLNPTGLRPAGAPSLPIIEKNWEFRPRLYVEAIDPENRLLGRPVFADFATDQGTLGIPGDSRGLFTVTSITPDQRTTPYAVVGTPPFLELAKQQLLFVPDQVGVGEGTAFGAPLATSFAGGAAASLLSSGLTPDQVRTALRQQQGHALRVGR